MLPGIFPIEDNGHNSIISCSQHGLRRCLNALYEVSRCFFRRDTGINESNKVGQVVITDQIFPSPGSDGLAVFATGGTARASLRIWHLKSIWP